MSRACCINGRCRPDAECIARDKLAYALLYTGIVVVVLMTIASVMLCQQYQKCAFEYVTFVTTCVL